MAVTSYEVGEVWTSVIISWELNILQSWENLLVFVWYEREIGKVKWDVEEDLKKKPVNARNGNVTYVQWFNAEGLD